jgi:hypothetical protein
MRVLQIKPVCGASGEYSQSQVIAWHTSSQLQAVQQNGRIRANRNGVTWLNASIPGAESTQMSCHSILW